MRVVVVGCGGRMGSEVCRLLEAQQDVALVGGIEAPGHKLIGTSLGSGRVSDQLARVVGQADCIVDFSTAEATAPNARIAAQAGRPFVTGVTGLSDTALAVLRECAVRIPLVHAPNFSVGISLLTRLVVEAARALGVDYDVEIVETHHRHKRDAPSGTALRLLDAVKQVRDMTEMSGISDRGPHLPGIASLRIGDVVGDHTVIFGGPGERLELTHRATSRQAFASGVLAAVRFVCNKKPGFYTIDQVLGWTRPAP